MTSKPIKHFLMLSYITLAVLVNTDFINSAESIAQLQYPNATTINSRPLALNGTSLPGLKDIHLVSLNEMFYPGIKINQVWSKCFKLNSVGASNDEMLRSRRCLTMNTEGIGNLVDLNNNFILGMHLGIVSAVETTNEDSSFPYPFKGAKQLYFGMQALVSTSSFYLGTKLSKYNDYVGWRNTIGNAISVNSEDFSQNWVLLGLSGINFTGSDSRFFGPTLDLLSYSINFDGYDVKNFHNNNIQIGIKYADTVTSHEDDIWALFYRFHGNIQAKEVKLADFISDISNLNNLYLNLGTDWVFKSNWINLTIGLGYDSHLKEYKQVHKNFIDNWFFKLALSLNL